MASTNTRFQTDNGNSPLVSCIMPTYNRRRFVPLAIKYFLRQDYPNRELIIVDDGTDSIGDLVPKDKQIRYFRLEKKITLGAKLNMACEHARGSIIAHWDDDDWYAARRLSYQVNALLQNGTALCGINRLLYYDLRTGRAYQYIYPADQRLWLLGSALCYEKELWVGDHFREIDVGMDGLFVWATDPDRITVHDDSTFSVFFIHEHNVSPKRTEGQWWHSYSTDKIQELLDSDWSFYRPDDSQTAIETHRPTCENDGETEKPAEPIRNIFACLVHESQECVVDLVRNLKYLDPSSQILLYNGGTDRRLLRGFPFEQYGAVVTPTHRALKWGHLHDFALDCMRYAIENLSFDILTVVDSDQLCVGRDYSDYMAEHLHKRSNIGMLGITDERQLPDTNHYVALHAYKEIELWRPFLERFPGGISKFLFWTFWPSTVFTREAAVDLVQLFDTDQQLKDILRKSRIWASEEVILPTLVSLLGYEVKKNPCAYDYMKYRQRYSLDDIKSALNQSGVFWVHPVARAMRDEVRRYIAEYFDHYKKEPRYESGSIVDSSGDKVDGNYVFVLPVIRQIENIEGWLDNDEAELLFHAAHDVLTNKARDAAVVEIGSYCGKSTIVLGNVVKGLSDTSSRVYAIDSFDGKVGALDKGIEQMPPTYTKFKENINRAGLESVIHTVRSKSYEVADWRTPIGFLFIDGLHDYANVACDFCHFERYVVQGGYVAFHDYADSFPGVKTFVDELLSSGKYRKVSCIKSMIIIEKIGIDDSIGEEAQEGVTQFAEARSRDRIKVAKLILHHNTPDLTLRLSESLNDAIIIDNGSEKSLSAVTDHPVIRFDENCGFTLGWNRAVKLLYDEYDAFWLMNSDISIEQEVVRRIEDLLGNNEYIGMITPSFNSWMDFLQNKRTGGIREVPFIELTAPVVTKNAFETVGFLDERFSLGYGVDFDFGFRLRKAGLKMFVDDGSEFHHAGHQTVNLRGGIAAYSRRASAEMNRGLTAKYGENWRGVIFDGTDFRGPVFP